MAEMLLEPRTALGPRNLVRVLNQIRDLGGSDNAPGWIPAPLSVSSAKIDRPRGGEMTSAASSKVIGQQCVPID